MTMGDVVPDQTTTALETEIREQPAALQHLLDAETDPARRFVDQWRGRGDVTSVLLAARGTSDNVARYAQYVLGAANALQVGLAAPSLFTRYRRPPRLDGMLVGAISQSGQSPDVVEVLTEASNQGRPTFAITNDPGSPLAEQADAVIGLHAGVERSVAATKTYTTSLAAIALLSVSIDDTDRADDLARVPGQVADGLDRALTDVEVPAWLTDASACAVVGRGYNYSTAFETALKIKELTGLAAEPYSSADFLHGPIAAVRHGVPAVLVVPSGVVASDVAEVADRLQERGTKLVVVSDDPAMLERADLPLSLPPDVPEWLSPLTAIVPGQVLAWRLAVARGLDVDRPEGLQKVTETH